MRRSGKLGFPVPCFARKTQPSQYRNAKTTV